VKEVELEGVSRPLADNQIEVRTREERIPPSFFVKARSCNSLALARLLFQLGNKDWRATVKAQAAPAVTNADRHATAGEKDKNLIPFLLHAEESFTLFAAPYDLAMTRRKIGETYLDRIRFVEEGTAPSSSLEPGPGVSAGCVPSAGDISSSANQQAAAAFRRYLAEQERRVRNAPAARAPQTTDLLTRLCSNGAKWLELAAMDYDKIDAGREAAEAWEFHAEMLRRWAEYEPAKRDDAIKAYENLCQHTGLSEQPLKLSAHRITLVQFYESAGRLRDAGSLLGKMETSTESIAHLKAMVHAELLLDEPLSPARQTLEECERDFELLLQARLHDIEKHGSARGTPQKYALADGSRLSRSIGILAWHLAKLCQQRTEGQRALAFLRAARRELTEEPALVARCGQDLPSTIGDLWYMASVPDDVMIQDFVGMVLPLMGSENRGTIERMLEEVWTREMARKGARVSFAALEMGLILCEHSLEHRTTATGKVATLVQTLRGWLAAAPPTSLEDAPRNLARVLTLLLWTRETFEDDKPFQAAFDQFHSSLEQQGAMDAVFRMLVQLVQMLMQLHMRSRKDWYNNVIFRVASRLQAAQEYSSNQFDDVTALIDLYVQLPNRKRDAVKLLEQQCERLLDQQNYSLLSDYLSFLSDMLKSALERDMRLAAYKKFLELPAKTNESGAPANGALAEETAAATREEPLLETERTEKLRGTALKLCGRVIARLLRERDLTRRDARGVLYNAAKLLDDEGTGDLRCAIYSKLYELSPNADGTCVWGVYSALSDEVRSDQKAYLDDLIALTCFSNLDSEDADGGSIAGRNPRNYLITAISRNLLIKARAAEENDNSGLLLAHAMLEVHRLRYIKWLSEHVREAIAGWNDFKKLEFVSFLHQHLFHSTDNLFLWQMIQRIESYHLIVEQQVDEVLAEASNALSGISYSGDPTEEASRKVQELLVASRRRGREIMTELAARIRRFTLSEILGEIQRHLEHQDRKIFRDALGMDQENAELADARRSGYEQQLIRHLLETDPSVMLPMLLSNGRSLLVENEVALAEKFYRRALELTDSTPDASKMDRVEIFCGLMRALRALERIEEARHFGERVTEVYESENGPALEWSNSEKELAELLLISGDRQAALTHFRKAVWIVRCSEF